MILIIDTETYNTLKGDYNDLKIKQIAWKYYDLNGSLIHEKDYEFNSNDTILIKNVLEEINELLITTCLLVGHNIQFDENLLVCLFSKYSIPYNFFGARYCTMRDTGYAIRLGDFRSKFLSLTELYKKLFHCDFKNKHNARADVNATSECFWHIINKRHIDLKIFQIEEIYFSDDQKERYNEWFYELSINDKVFFCSYFLSDIELNTILKTKIFNLNEGQLLRMYSFVYNQKEIYYNKSDLSPLKIFSSIEKIDFGSYYDSEYGLDFVQIFIESLDPIRTFYKLKQLKFKSNNSSIDSISFFQNLEYLEFWAPNVRDIQVLTNCNNLIHLKIYECNVVDIPILDAMINLEVLIIRSKNLRNIEALKALKKLRRLEIWSAELSNIESLSSITSLEYLNLSGCPKIKDISPVNELQKLKEVDLRDMNVDSSLIIQNPNIQVLK